MGVRPLYIIAIILVLASCERRPKPPLIKDGLAIAEVGETIITDKDLLGRIASIEKTFPRVYNTHPRKKDLLEEMMNIELLYQEALKKGLDKRYEFKSRLADLYVNDLSDQAKKSVTDKQVREFYKNNKLKYDQIAVRHILFSFPPRISRDKKQELLKRLNEIRRQAMKAPDTFPQLAKQHSQDGSREQGGDLGYFTYDMMVEPFSKAAFNLKNIGEISKPVETRFGYHLIQLTGDRRGFEHYKDLALTRLMRQTQKGRIDEEIAKLKSKKSFKLYEENLSKLSSLPEEVLQDPDSLLPRNLKKRKR